MIAEDRRRSEREYWAAFDAVQPRVLGAFLNALSTMLAREPDVRPSRLPRMADFYIQVEAATPALGWPAGAFLKAYTGNRAGAHESILESSVVAVAVRALIANAREWSGTHSELLSTLTKAVDDPVRKERWWPKTPRGLSGALRRLAPNLREVGVNVTFCREHSRRVVTIQTVPADDRRDRPNDPTADPAPDGQDDRNARIRDVSGIELCTKCWAEPRKPGFQWGAACFHAVNGTAPAGMGL